MTKEQAAAFVQAQTVCALAEIEAMKAENRHRATQGYSDAYGEEEFLAVPARHQITRNQVALLFQEVSHD
jgi:hypothetical protein